MGNLKKWYVYMLRCENDSIYTGITTDVEKRFQKHLKGEGAKYTRSRKPKEICTIFEVENRSFATKLEIFIKKLSKKEKELLILDNKNKKNKKNQMEKELKMKIN